MSSHSFHGLFTMYSPSYDLKSNHRVFTEYSPSIHPGSFAPIPVSNTNRSWPTADLQVNPFANKQVQFRAEMRLVRFPTPLQPRAPIPLAHRLSFDLTNTSNTTTDTVSIGLHFLFNQQMILHVCMKIVNG